MTPGAALLVALLSQSTTVAAGPGRDAAPTRVRLEVRASGDCTSRHDLMARIAARSSRIEIGDGAPVVARVAVTSQRPGNVVADLVLADPAGDQAPRRVVARSCAEVADGVALIIAVTLDPALKRDLGAGATERPKVTDAGKAAAASAPNAPNAIASTPEPAFDPARRPDAEPAEQPAAARRPEPTAVVKSVAPVHPTPTGTRREFGASLAGQTFFGVAPKVMPGVAVYAIASLDRDGPWSPALYIGITHAWRSDLSEPGGAASFALDAASVDACPLRLRWSRLTARPCASVLLGRLTAQGSNTGDAAGAVRPFGVAGAVMSASFGSPIELSARLGVGVTVIRDSYEFATDVFYRASPLTVSASIGAGVRWP